MNFAERVYEKLQEVPRGKVTTYKELARALNTRAYRAVGGALRNNPRAPEVPCHRVIRSDGTIGGFGGQTKGKKIDEKIALLNEEGVVVKDGRVVELQRIMHAF